MRVICTRTGGCRSPLTLPQDGGCPDERCPYFTRISEPIEVEDVDWREEHKRLSDWCGSQEDEVIVLERLRDSLLACYEELAGELRFWQESGLYPLGISPGPGWYWVKGHWRSRTAPEARASQAPTGDKAGELGESQAQADGQPQPFRDGVTLWYCDLCGKPTDIYPCRMCGGVPLSPESAKLVRQGLEDCAAGRVQTSPDSGKCMQSHTAVCRWEVGRWGI